MKTKVSSNDDTDFLICLDSFDEPNGKRDRSSTVRTQQDAGSQQDALTPETVDNPLAGAGAARAIAASRQPPNIYKLKFHMHIIDIPMRACEIFTT